MPSEPAGCEADAVPSLGESSIEAAGSAEAGEISRRDARAGIPEPSHLAREVHEFLVQRQIEDEVRMTLSLARRHFMIVGEPAFDIVNDPDCGEHYIGIHVRAEGRPEQVFRQNQAFLDSFLDRIEPAKQKYINLVYHPTSD
jgi:hypothetical protein